MSVRIDNSQMSSIVKVSQAETQGPANAAVFSRDKSPELPSEKPLASVAAPAPERDKAQQVDEMAKAIIRVLDGNVDDLESSSTISKLNELMRDRERDLEFLVDDSTGRNVLKVLHAQSRELIRQFPSEEVLRVAEFIITGKSGLLNDQA